MRIRDIGVLRASKELDTAFFQSRLGELNDVTATVRARLQESIGMDAKDPGASTASTKPKPVDDKEITFGQI